MAQEIIKVGIVGGTGYTGVELLRLLAQHPNCELTAITSRQEAGMPVADMFPNLRGWTSISISGAGARRARPMRSSFFSPRPTASR